MIDRDFDALVLDLDGTLLDDSSRVLPRTHAALKEAALRGVHVMVATGRSNISAQSILAALDLESPAVVFNGAGLYCARTQRMLEERVLSNRTLERALEFGRRRDLSMVVMCADKKLATAPRDDVEAAALSGMTALQFVASAAELTAEFVIRVTYFSSAHGSSEAFAAEIERAVDQPVYMTHFPLNVLPMHRASSLAVVDLHPPCSGKAEALRVLRDTYGIPAHRVVAVGDATNDVPMFRAAGLSVAMGSGMEEARAAAQRVIGDNNSPAIAELVEELFLARREAV
jgi:Cof subfamily protein (haloacid dehalogenase superfamily)